MVTQNDIIPSIQALKETLARNKIPISRAILFGSYAKGLEQAFSDIDVALVSEEFSGNRFWDIEKVIPFIRSLNPLFEIHPFRPEDFLDTDNSFIEEIISTGIEV